MPTPFVFVHGLFGPFDEPAAFDQIPADCSAPDLPGYGRHVGDKVTLAGQVASLRVHLEHRHPGEPVNLVAHSIGAVYAFALADAAPALIRSVTTVEGNFSLADAFWSRSIAALDAGGARTTIERRLADPAALLAGDGIPATRDLLARAERALAFQPWLTVWESAIAVVDATASERYPAMVQRVFARTPVYLVAGERTSRGWDVPGWARRAASGSSVQPGVGHMMMLEQPEEFGQVLARLHGTGVDARSASGADLPGGG